MEEYIVISNNEGEKVLVGNVFKEEAMREKQEPAALAILRESE